MKLKTEVHWPHCGLVLFVLGQHAVVQWRRKAISKRGWGIEHQKEDIIEK
jgi:hypothetical protein